MRAIIRVTASVFSCIPLLLLVLSQSSFAGIWPKPTSDAYSSGTGYEFRVLPDLAQSERNGHCRGELYRVENGAERILWSRYLINDRRPVDIMVSPTGEHVITLDDWYCLGKFPIVIHGANGRLEHVYSELKALNLPFSETKTMAIGVVGVGARWRVNTIEFFTPEGDFFVIRLRSGRLLTFRLKPSIGLVTERDFNHSISGTREWERIHGMISEQIKAIAMERLYSENAHDRETGAIVVGQLGIDEAIPRLEELMNDPNSYTTGGLFEREEVFFVRKAANEALAEIRSKSDQKRGHRKRRSKPARSSG